MRRLRYPAYALLAVAMLLALLSGWLLYTASGAAWLWARAGSALDGRLAGQVSGSLRGGLTVTELRFVDGQTRVESERVEFALDPDLFPLGLVVDGPRAASLSVTLGPGAADDEAGGPELPLADVLAALAPPLPIEVRGLELEQVSVAGPAGESLFAARSIALDARLDEQLLIERLVVAIPDGRLSARGTLTLQAPYPLDLLLELETPGQAALGLLPGRVRAEIGGNPSALELDAATEQPAARIRGRIAQPLERPVADLVLTSPSLPLVAADGSTLVEFTDVQLDVSGAPDDYRARGTARAVTQRAAPLGLELDVTGDLAGLDEIELRGTSPELAASLDGRLGWQQGLAAAARLDVARLDPGRWFTDWPEGEQLSAGGSLALEGRRLDVESLLVRHREARVDARGVVDLDAGVVDLALDWQALQWPLRPADPRLSSSTANVTVRGAPDDWTLSGEVALSAPELPEGRFVLAGGGGPAGVRFRIDEGRVLGGELRGEVAVDYRDGGLFRADLATAGIRVETLLPDWPGSVSAELEAEGRFEPLAVELRIGQLDGQLRARPVAASGTVSWQDARLAFDAVNLRSGSTRLAIDGGLDAAGGIEFRVDSESLADLLPDADGRVTASGRVLRDEPWPRVEVDLNASGLGWRDWAVDRLAFANAPGEATGLLAAELELAGLQAGGRRIENLDAGLAGDPGQHRLRLELDAAEGRASV